MKWGSLDGDKQLRLLVSTLHLTRLKEVVMKVQNKRRRLLLGDLIVALFEETRKVSKNKLEQRVLVYAALKDLLKKKVHSNHHIALTPA